MAEDFPDFTRAVRLLGIDDAGDLVTVLVDSAGNLGAIVKGLAPGDVLTAIAVDASGQLVMVPRGQSGNYMLVDDSGFLLARMIGQIPEVGQAYVAVDASGQIIMVPRGQSGYYLNVDANGYMGAILKAAADVNVQGSVPVDQNSAVREVQGADGETLRTVVVDANGQMIMVPRGQSGYYMSVDASGYLTAVLKGLYSGELNTIAVDTNGRIEAFGLDGEDQWGQVLKTGNSDLAARLGSPVNWDWRGSVIYTHDFSMGKGPVFTSLSGTGAAAAIDPTYGGYGGYALKLTGGSDATRFSRFGLSIGTNPSDRIGGAVRFSIADNTGYVELRLHAYVGATSPWAYVRLDVANGQIQLYNSVGSWVNVGAVTVNKEAFTYSWFKLVVNQTTKMYERVLYNKTEVDISAYGCPIVETTDDGSMLFCLFNYSRSGQNDVVYVDQIILTVNEPENA